MIKEQLNTAKKANTNFLYSFSLLPKKKNEAIKIIYAYCRATDDIADNETDDNETKLVKLENWKIELQKALSDTSDISLLNSLSYVIKEFNIPHKPFYELIEGMESDILKFRYDTFDELYDYCYKVASTVGLMSIPVFGYKTSKAKDYAVNLGVAMQLTNIIRDVYSDMENNRIYIPHEDLVKFGYSEDDLRNSVYNEKFIELMKHQCKRARSYYLKADNSFLNEDKRLLFPARIMQKIYYNILKKIESLNYNIFNRRISISKFKKMYLAFSTYMKYNLAYK